MQNSNEEITVNQSAKGSYSVKSFRGKIGRRICAIVIISFIITIIAIAGIAISQSSALAESLLMNHCSSATRVLQQRLGEDAVLTDDYSALLDELKEETDCELTIFSGNKRISTTIMSDGKRAVGTTLDDKVADIVLNQKQAYTGNADILGVPHICSYVPVVNNGKAVGLLFAGISQAEVNNIMADSISRIISVSILLLICCCILISLFVTFCISRPLKQLTVLAQKMENGNLGISSGKALHTNIHSNDEIGLLAATFESTFMRLKNYIKEINDYLGKLAQKDLRAKITLDYVGDFVGIRNSLENISTSLNQTMEQIHTASRDVSSGSSQVSQAAQILSSGATQQANAIEELSSSLVNISEHVNQNSITAHNAQEKAVLIDNFIQDTNVQMKQMVAAMEQIALASQEIATIDKTMGDIAFQTNILALNASVEASHAGEAGKGFAAVANEVRNLASKSAEASKNTDELIGQAIQAIESGTKIVNSTMQSTIHAADSIDEIVEMVTNISSATTEQATSIQQCSSTIKEISTVVQTNSATAEETASTSEELSSRAEALLEMVDAFVLAQHRR